MTIEEKKEEMTNRVWLKLEEIDFKILGIMTHLSKDSLLRDMTRKDVLITSFIEPILGSNISVITDPDTLEMLYVRTGVTNFVEIEHFFKKYEED